MLSSVDIIDLIFAHNGVFPIMQRPTFRTPIPKYLHGPYYRWTGWINGRLTTKSISEDIARECRKRIENCRELQKKDRGDRR
jgi:hypothetical protein